MGKVKALYGGAVETFLPEGFLDASLLREIPDTQEVYVNSRQDDEQYDDELGKSESIVIDLLERINESDDLKALKEHVADISNLNGSSDFTFLKNETIAPSRQCCIVSESVNKWGKIEMKDRLILCVGLIRLNDLKTDVVITINVPITTNEEVKTHELTPGIMAAYKLLLKMVREFNVVDRTIFI